MMKKISEEQIEEITKLSFRNAGARITGILKELEEFQEDELRDKLRRFLMNKGKSDITKGEVWKILDDTKLNKQGGKMEEGETKTEEDTKEEKEETEEKDKEE